MTALNARSLKAVRRQRKLTVGDVADFTKISPNSISSFEEGDREPTWNQLTKLAELYNVREEQFYSEGIPNFEESPPDFRRRDPTAAELTPRGWLRIWKTEQIADFTRELIVALGRALPERKAFRNHQSLSTKVAADYREGFDEWFSSKAASLKLQGPPEAQAFLGLRLYLETFESLTTVNDAPPSDYLGFFKNYGKNAETVFVNRSISSKKAQLFTLVHEWGHILLNAEGISDPFDSKNAVERMCNSFAAEFLAPEAGFRNAVERARPGTLTDASQLIRFASNHTFLSQQAAAIRLLELGYLRRTQVSEWFGAFRRNPKQEKEEEKEAAGSGGPGPFAKRLGEVGYFATYVAWTAVQEKIATSVDIQRGLGLHESLQEQAFDLARRRVRAAFR